MLGPKITPVIFLVLPPTILLMAQASAGKPTAAECSTRPGSTAPQGTHWYYRVNRTDNRHCWYLSSGGMKVRSDSRAATSDAALPSSTPKRDNDSETARATPPQLRFAQIAPVEMATAQVTPADPAFLETRVDGHATAMDFNRRWRGLSASPNLEASEFSPISNSYTDMQTAADAEQQMPLIWPVTEAEHVAQRQDPAGQAAFGSVFLVSALALGSLSLFGGVFNLVRRSRQGYLRDPWRAPTGPLPRPTDPAHDLKTSLAELMQALQRAGAASYSPRAFAPPVRRARQGTADRTNLIVRGEVIVPAREAKHTERVATEGLKFRQQRKAHTVQFSLSGCVASILGVEPSLALAQAADEGAARQSDLVSDRGTEAGAMR